MPSQGSELRLSLGGPEPKDRKYVWPSVTRLQRSFNTGAGAGFSNRGSPAVTATTASQALASA